MRRFLRIAPLLALLLPAAALAQNPDPRERTVKLEVDGQSIDGCVGFRIDFARNVSPGDNSRRMDRNYFPEERRLVLTLTQKGMNRLQSWLNDATDGGTPVAKTLVITARNNREETLARWQVSGVVPQTFSAGGTGVLTELDAIVEFSFDRLRLLEARAEDD